MNRTTLSNPLTLAARSLFGVACFAPLLTAQAPTRDPAAGFGARTAEIDWEVLTGEVGQLGITWSPQTEEICSTVRIDPSAGGLHYVQFVDYQGANPRSWFQPAIAQASEWGWRDGATDGASLLFGYELGVQVVDPVDGSPVLEVLTANQPSLGSGRSVAGLIVGDVLDPTNAGVARAIAYDPAGDDGDGSLWTGNFGSDTFEIDLEGNILRSFPNVGEVHYGMGLDPATGNLILNSQSTPGILNYDTTTGSIDPADSLALPQGIAGGAEMLSGDVFRGPNASGYDFLALAQGTPDIGYGYRYHLDVVGSTPGSLSTNTRLGTDEPDLVQTIDDGEFFVLNDRGSIRYSIDAESLEFDLRIARDPGNGTGSGGLNGRLGLVYAQTSPDADIDSSSFLLRELVHLQTNGVTVDPASAAPRAFPMVMSNSATTPSLVSLAFPTEPFQNIGECIRLQAVYLDVAVDFLPLATTNQTRFCRGPDPVILSGAYFETFGTNSFNDDLSSGFFSLTNEFADPDKSVVALTMSWLGASSSAQIDNFMRFDLDNPGLLDSFLFGTSKEPGCSGTYRNNSDVETGLLTDGTSLGALGLVTPLPPTCPPEIFTGFIPSDPGTAIGGFEGDYLTLDFRFAPGVFLDGKVFEFDVDTDNGLGVTGGDMEFLVITVEFADGTTSTAEIVPDPNLPIRGYAQL